MPLDFIHRFQLKILQMLLASEALQEHVQAIYISTAQDGKYPCILINFVKVENKSSRIQEMYLVEFEICIFSRDKNKKSLLTIADGISIVMTSASLAFAGYAIAGIRQNDLVFNEAKDLVHNKLTINYKAVIKKRIEA